MRKWVDWASGSGRWWSRSNAGHMGAAGLALPGVAHHDDVRDRQRRRHGLGRAGVDFVVQRHPLRMGLRRRKVMVISKRSSDRL
jgi:hypothetical protein